MNKRQICRERERVIGHKLFEEIISPKNLLSAWKEFRKGKRKKQDVQEFEFKLEDNLFRLHQELEDKTYQPDLYLSFHIQDPKLRHIHKASVRDRILHQAIFRILYPIFDKSFIYDSYSSRADKGTHAGVNRLERFLVKASQNNHKVVYALKCDISKFFDSIDQGILLNLIKKKISDLDTLWLIKTIIKSFEKSPSKGLPLGNVTSQLFANIYMNELDQFAKHKLKIKYYIRYADDFIALSSMSAPLIELIPKIDNFLTTSLKLRLHPNKIIIRKYSQGIDFLGYVLRPRHRLLRTKTKRRLFNKINEKNKPSYLGLLRHGNTYKIKRRIDIYPI